MKKKTLFSYLALILVPFIVGCSVGKDNVAKYYVSGNLRQSLISELTQNYWTNYKSNEINKTTNKDNVYDSLTKEDGVGVTLSLMKLIKVDNNGNIKIVSNGNGIEKENSFLFDCQDKTPDNITDEEKKKLKPNASNCNENNKEIDTMIKDNSIFYFLITYKGGKYATSKIPKNSIVNFCVETSFSYNSLNSLEAKIKELKDESC